ncbi:MAG TPA: agmatinase [Solirubrobacteraceae bacterium]|jgi:agmatinase|nr:agmatinase [Solirubrobacteraceae bacterium]
MIDPRARWSHVGEKPDYAGLLTFCGLPYTEDPDELAGADAVIVGAPMDDLVSDHPGTRHGPRAIRAASAIPGPHLEAGVDPFERLRVVDFGDAPVLPADPARSHSAIEDLVGAVAGTGAIPIVLGGDHSIAEPDIRACARAHGPVGLVHFDSHTDTAPECFGVTLSHGTPMYRLVESGHVDPARYVQIGLRGYWPGAEVFEWQRERGITALFMHDIRDRGITQVIGEAVAAVGGGPVFMSVDVDVLDPAFAPGTGTPEPGGMTSADLLWACRTIAGEVDLVGADVVEVSPTSVGSSDISALVASRVVHEILTGVAVARLPRPGPPDLVGSPQAA